MSNFFNNLLGGAAQAQTQIPLVNGYLYSFASIELRAGAGIANGIRSIDYSQPGRPGAVFGNRQQKEGRTRGKLEPAASLVMLRGHADKLRAELGPGYRNKPFDILVNFREGNAMVTDTLVGCIIADEAAQNGSATGNEPATIRFDLDPMYILYNGVLPVEGLTK